MSENIKSHQSDNEEYMGMLSICIAIAIKERKKEYLDNLISLIALKTESMELTTELVKLKIFSPAIAGISPEDREWFDAAIGYI